MGQALLSLLNPPQFQLASLYPCCCDLQMPQMEAMEKRAQGGLNFGGLELVPKEAILPLPEVTTGLPVDPAVGYATQEISPGIHIVTNGAYVNMIAVTSEGVVLFDCPPTVGVRCSLLCLCAVVSGLLSSCKLRLVLFCMDRVSHLDLTCSLTCSLTCACSCWNLSCPWLVIAARSWAPGIGSLVGFSRCCRRHLDPMSS